MVWFWRADAKDSPAKAMAQQRETVAEQGGAGEQAGGSVSNGGVKQSTSACPPPHFQPRASQQPPFADKNTSFSAAAALPPQSTSRFTPSTAWTSQQTASSSTFFPPPDSPANHAALASPATPSSAFSPQQPRESQPRFVPRPDWTEKYQSLPPKPMQPAPADTALPPVPLRRTSLSDGRPSRLPPLPSHSARPPTTQRAAAQPRKPEDLEPEDAPRGEAREPTQPPDSSSYDASILRFASAPLTQPALDLSPTSTRASPPSPLAPSPPAPHSPTFDLSESQLAKIEQLARQSKSYISVAQAVGCTRAEVVEGVRELVRQGRLSAKSHPKPVETSASRKVAASPAPAPPPPPARGEGEALPPQEPLLEPPPDPAVFLARRPSPFLSPAPPSPESLPASLEPLHAASSLIALSPIAVVPLSTVSAHPALATASRRPDAAAAADQPAKLGPKSEEGAEPTPGVEKKTGVWTDEETDLLLHLYKRGIAREDISTLLQRKSRHVGDRLKRLVSYGYLDTFSWDATRPSDLECASACAEEFLAAAAAEKSARSPSAASSGHETYWQYEAPGKELTAEQLDLIARMKTEGASKGEIAERVGCRVKALVTAYALLGKDGRLPLLSTDDNPSQQPSSISPPSAKRPGSPSAAPPNPRPAKRARIVPPPPLPNVSSPPPWAVPTSTTASDSPHSRSPLATQPASVPPALAATFSRASKQPFPFRSVGQATASARRFVKLLDKADEW